MVLYGIRTPIIGPLRAWKPPIPYAIKNQRGASPVGGFGSQKKLALYGIRDRWLPCTERSYYRSWFFMAQESWRSNIMILDLISDLECSTLSYNMFFIRNTLVWTQPWCRLKAVPGGQALWGSLAAWSQRFQEAAQRDLEGFLQENLRGIIVLETEATTRIALFDQKKTCWEK